MADPVFFISYSRPDVSDRRAIDKVADALRRRVAELIGQNKADLNKIGFFDIESIKDGADWEQRLAPAVSNIGVVVCFCSPGYFNSAFCANEFDAFRARFEAASLELRARSPGPLIPIIWDRPPNGVLPAAIRRFYQPGDRSFPKAYEREGLYTLARLSSRKDAFVLTIDTIARYIHKAAQPPPLQPLKRVAQFSELACSFDNPRPGPYQLAITVFASEGARWSANPVGPRLADAIESVADTGRLGWREIPVTDDLPTVVRAAAAQRSAHIFIVPESVAGEEPWTSRLDQLGGLGLKTAGLLIAEDARIEPSQNAPCRVLQRVPSLAASGFVVSRFDPNVANDLDERLMELITRIRTRLISEDEPSKIESPEHSAAAQAAGVPIETRPLVSGAGQRQ
jgi:hypothetical protein